MTNHPPILRNSALMVPLAVLAGLSWSPADALAALVSSGVVLLNLWVLSVLGPRLVTALAREEVPMIWLAALLAKFLVLVGTYLALLRVLPGFGLAMGFVPLITGTLVTGLELAWREQRAEAA